MRAVIDLNNAPKTMSIEERLEDYNSIYGFKNDTRKYSFENNPERIIVRNTALRERDAEVYASYLRKNYPASLEREMEQFHKSLSDTRQLTMDEATDFFDTHGIIVVQSDIAQFEDDAIFTPKIFSQSEADALIEQSLDNPMLQYIALDIINNRDKIWIDASEIRQIYPEDRNL